MGTCGPVFIGQSDDFRKNIVGNRDLVLVVLHETAAGVLQDVYSLAGRQFIDDDTGKSAIQCRVIHEQIGFLAGGGADASDIAPGQCRLENLCDFRIGLPGMVVSQLMDFVNEQDDTFLRVRSEVDDGLDFFFQLSDIAGAGYDVAQRKFVDFAAHELIRNGRVVVFQSVGKVFHDFGLAGAGGADQNGVGLVLSDEYAGELLGDGFTEQNGSGGLESFVVVDEKFIGNGAAVGLHYDRGRNAALIALVAFVVGVGTREVVQAHLGASFPKFCPG